MESNKKINNEVWHRLKKNKLAIMGLAVLIFFFLIAVFADFIADYETQALAMSPNRLQQPSSEHWFGTDHMGRDVFARIVHGTRLSLFIGFAVTGASLVIGGFLGAMAGYFGGKIDNVIMRIMDIITCIPTLLLCLAIIAALGTNLMNLLIAVSFSYITSFARVVRSVILSIAGNDFIEAAKACGMSNNRIIIKHVLPNAVGPIIVQATMGVANIIILAAGLSFIGMGVQPPQPEWGAMLSEANAHMRNHPHLVIAPGMAIIMSALSLNLLGDGLRDALDPRLKG